MNSALLWLLHSITCSLPLLGSSLFAWAVIAAQRDGDTPITEWTVSSALAAYPNYEQLLTLLIIASSLIFATIAVRNVQVRIWFRRRYGSYLQSCCSCCCKKKSTGNNTRSGQLSQGSATFLAFINDVGSVINILAYVSFLLLVIYPADAPTAMGRMLHEIGAIGYIALSIIYGIIQVILTSKQGDHYPKFVRIFQILLTLASAITGITFAVSFYATESPLFLAEWLFVAFTLLFTAFFAVMFHIDSASDELVEFFCPCCCGGGGKKNKRDEASSYKSMA